MVAYPLPAASTLAAPVTVTGVTAKTPLLSGLSIPASTLAAGQLYKAEAWGVLTTAAITDAYTLELDYGATDVMDFGAQVVSGTLQTGVRWNMSLTLEMMSATLARCWGWDGLAFFFSAQNGKETTLNALAAIFSLQVTPNNVAASLTCNGAFIRREA